MVDYSSEEKPVILWDARYSLVTALVSLQDHNAYLAALQLLTDAKMFGPLLSADLPDWAERSVETEREDDEDEGEKVSDETPWVFSLDSMDDEAYPCPWDWNHLAEAEWAAEVEDVLLEHGSISGGPGYIDVYQVYDLDGLIGALSERGYQLEQHAGLIAAYTRRGRQQP